MEKHHSREHAKHTGHHASPHRGKEDAKAQKIIIMLSIALFAFAAYNLYIVYASNAAVADKIAAERAAATEAARPANLQITKILAQDCSDCLNITQLESDISRLNVNVSEKSIDYSGAEAQQLISKYNIKKIPSMLITGETEKAGIGFWSQIGTKESDGTLVLRYGLPYIDPSSRTEIGKVRLVEIEDKSCGSCYNVSLHRDILKEMGIVLSGISKYDIAFSNLGSGELKGMIAKYNITKVPTILLSPDLDYYDESLKDFMLQFGTKEADGWYVFRKMEGMRDVIYKDLSLNKTVNTTAQ